MNKNYFLAGCGLLMLSAAVVISCDDSGSDGDNTGGDAGGVGGGKTGGKGGGGGAGGLGGKGGTAGSTGGTAGSTGGTAGSAGGTAGSTGGMAGAMGGMAGSTGGMAGAMGGMAGMKMDAGVDAMVDANTMDGAATEAGTDSGADSMPPPPGQLAHDPFGTTGRLHATPSGFGWGQPWSVQSDDDPTLAGYELGTAMPLTYLTLQSTPGHPTGGQAYESSGRRFDVASGGAFKDYLKDGLIGAAGKSLWISFLFRRDVEGDGDAHVSFGLNNIAWDDNSGVGSKFAFGFFGAASKTGAVGYWSLRGLKADVPVKTAAVVTKGQTILVVLNVSFTATGGTVKLYVSPTSLGGEAPATASAELTSTTALDFQNFTWYPGQNAGSGAIDEVRVGTTYASVTPTN